MKLAAIFPPLRPGPDRMLHLDAARSVAAASVVLFHACNLFGVEIAGLRPLVDLFFAVSGFVISEIYGERLRTGGQYRQFLVARAAKLLPLHWLMLAASIGLAVAGARLGVKANHPEAHRMDFGCIPANAALLHATPLGCHQLTWNFPSWSLSAEMFMYLAAPLLLPLRWRAAYATVAAIVVLSVVARMPGFPSTLSHAPWYEWTAYGGVFRAFPSFCFGIFLSGIKTHTRRIPARLGYLTAGTYAAGVVLGWSLFPLLLLVYATVACLVGADQRGRASRLARRLAPFGRLTYATYMIHTLVLETIVGVGADHLIHATGALRVAIGVAAFVAVLPLAYLCHVLFEEPLRRRIRGALAAVAGLKPALTPQAETSE